MVGWYWDNFISSYNFSKNFCWYNANRIRPRRDGSTKRENNPEIISNRHNPIDIYAVITLILFFLLFFIGDLNSFDSIVHSFSTVSSGGFSSYPLSIETLNNFSVEMIILSFMFLSGISFAIFYFVITGNFKKFGKIQNLKHLYYLIYF